MQNQAILFTQIFNKNLFESDSQSHLQQFCKSHPYCSIAQYFLLKQTQSQADNNQTTASQTEILFNNSHWLNYLLQQPIEKTDVEQTETTIDVINNEEEIKIQAEETINDAAKVELKVDEHTELNEERKITESAELLQTATAIPILLNTKNIEEEKNEETPVLKEVDNNNTEDLQTAIPTLIATPQTTLLEDDAKNILVDDNEIEQQSEHENEENENSIEEQSEPEITPINFKLNLQPTSSKNDEQIFEPMHLVDYFASQGIKLSNDISPNDKLGLQLKSFTQWLKTMKKLHQNPTTISTEENTQLDINIQQLAEKSNAENQVLTEAMAEVLVKQGKVDQAIELYQKLSLLNPVKSAYFAEKIADLKK
jgi:hypothetical protein